MYDGVIHKPPKEGFRGMLSKVTAYLTGDHSDYVEMMKDAVTSVLPGVEDLKTISASEFLHLFQQPTLISVCFLQLHASVADVDVERHAEQVTRYEDRITELHSVIAELRRKVDARQFNVIRYVARSTRDSSTLSGTSRGRRETVQPHQVRPKMYVSRSTHLI